MYNPSDDYKILRVVSVVIFTVGMLIVVGGLVSGFFIFKPVRELTLRYLILVTSDGAPLRDSFTVFVGVMMSVIWAVTWVVVGLLQIAISQLIQVFLDIRDDTRKTLQHLIASK